MTDVAPPAAAPAVPVSTKAEDEAPAVAVHAVTDSGGAVPVEADSEPAAAEAAKEEEAPKENEEEKEVAVEKDAAAVLSPRRSKMKAMLEKCVAKFLGLLRRRKAAEKEEPSEEPAAAAAAEEGDKEEEGGEEAKVVTTPVVEPESVPEKAGETSGEKAEVAQEPEAKKEIPAATPEKQAEMPATETTPAPTETNVGKEASEAPEQAAKK